MAPVTAPGAVGTLRQRSEFLDVARGRRAVRNGLVLQARSSVSDTAPRFGITCSRKVGNAVTRNRARRRLREAARAVLPEYGRQGWSYVLIGRHGKTNARAFAELKADLVGALKEVHA